jgi:hypothetical protein
MWVFPSSGEDTGSCFVLVRFKIFTAVTIPIVSAKWSLQPWRWTQQASPKRWLLPTNPHGVLTQKNVIKVLCPYSYCCDGASLHLWTWASKVPFLQPPDGRPSQMRPVRHSKIHLCVTSRVGPMPVMTDLTTVSQGITGLCNIPRHLVQMTNDLQHYLLAVYCINNNTAIIIITVIVATEIITKTIIVINV